MPDETHVRVQEILEEAVCLSPERRAAFIERACAGDPELLGEVHSLLPHYERTQDFEPARGPEWFLPGTTTITRARADVDSDPDADGPTPPFCIDQYRCDKVLGRGGMGIVYRATHATLRRRFAIKLLRGGLLSSETRWRFAFESQLLRRLQHPGIARIFHMNEVRGVTGTQPYFVMEFIRGKPLVQYADESGLNTLERLALIANVCEPIEYAHRRGVVHRDLKPGNILVDESGRPKILDFGIAQIQEFTPMSGADDHDRFVGTYEYASPEQVAGKNNELTPRSDVYALGLIAHELLTGTLPQTVDGRLRLDLGRVRVSEGPPELAARQKEFRYFLRAIFSASLAKSASDRYSSAGELGDAIATVAAEFHRPTGWSALRDRLSRLFTAKGGSTGNRSNRPLAAVLRTRIEMSLETDRPRESEETESPQPPSEGVDDDDIYHFRDTDE